MADDKLYDAATNPPNSTNNIKRNGDAEPSSDHGSVPSTSAVEQALICIATAAAWRACRRTRRDRAGVLKLGSVSAEDLKVMRGGNNPILLIGEEKERVVIAIQEWHCNTSCHKSSSDIAC